VKVNIVLHGSPFIITVELPKETDFVSWCKFIRSDGGIFSNELHIPYDKILGMGLPDKIMMQGPNAPTSETKQ
jgi:hypothetical protein